MNLEANRVCSIQYVCRVIDPRDPPERGTIYGFWTGAIDTWGKRTIIQIDGPTYYLFADEIKSVREVRKD